MEGSELIQAWKAMASLHERMRTVWDECARWFLPQQYPLESDDASRAANTITDTVSGVGIRAAADMAAGIFTNTVQIGEPWFQFDAVDAEQDDDESKIQRAIASRAVLVALQNSNIIEELHGSLQVYPIYGTGVIYQWSDNGLPRFRSYSIADCRISEDMDGNPNRVFRKYKMSAQQCVEWFTSPGDVIPATVRAQSEKLETAVTESDYLHVVIPRNGGGVRGSLRPEQSPVVGYHVHVESGTIIREESHLWFPYAVYRFSKIGTCPCGVGPGQQSLPDVRMMMRSTEDFIAAHEYAAEPPVFLPPGVSKDDVDMRAGAINSVVGPNGEMPVFATNGGVDFRAMMEFKIDIENKVREFFFSDLFRMLATAPKGMTATEVLERNNEKIQLLLPMISRMQSELFEVIVMNTLMMLIKSNQIQNPQFLVEEGKLGGKPKIKITYTNRLAARLKDVEISRTLEALQICALVMQSVQSSQVIDANLDSSKLVRMTLEDKGVRSEAIRPADQANKMLQAMEDQARAAMAQQAASGLIKPVDLQQAPAPGSALSAMEGQIF